MHCVRMQQNSTPAHKSSPASCWMHCHCRVGHYCSLIDLIEIGLIWLVVLDVNWCVVAVDDEYALRTALERYDDIDVSFRGSREATLLTVWLS